MSLRSGKSRRNGGPGRCSEKQATGSKMIAAGLLDAGVFRTIVHKLPRSSSLKSAKRLCLPLPFTTPRS